MKLTIWKIQNPNDINQYFYRWTFEAYFIFVTSQFEYTHEGICRRGGLQWALKHNYGIPKIKYNQRSNTEFLS